MAGKLSVLLAALLVAGLGCSKPPYELAPVHGKVTLDGRPVSKAKVMFAPIAQGKSRRVGKPAFGLLKPDGSFVLGTYEPEDGAVVGNHWVTVVRMHDLPGASRLPTKGSETDRDWHRVMVPQTKTVAPGQDNEINIELTAEIAAEYGQLDE